ncbi:MAG: carbohydrate kinase [Pseudomonadota bacterium]
MNARYVVFGEALTDFLRQEGQLWQAVAGGSCWNVARAGARLGVDTGFAGCVSSDHFGDDIARLSAQAGLDLDYLQRADRAPLLAMVVSTRPPSYFFVGEDSADLHFSVEALPTGWLAAADIIHFGSISLAREPLAGRLLAVAEQVKAAGKRIAFDPNWRNAMGPAYSVTLGRMARLADYIKVSDEDLLHLFPSLDEEMALQQLRSWAPTASILFTRGAAGLELLTPCARVRQQAFQVELADTVGCGDASMAGWICSQLRAPDAAPAQHAAFAAACAAVAASHHGAYAPTLAEVEAMLGAPTAL